ncbi:MAG TPA: DUF2804 domain-containing protein [bacterium]|nr:DUF2804 domain-containing protein [bacterium]
MAEYIEREITEQVLLCDEKGELNRGALGWSRVPLHTCNLSGHWPRKKKWNFWMILNEDFAFSATVANIDYLGVGSVSIHNFKTGKRIDGASVSPRGLGVNMPPKVEENVRFKDAVIKVEIAHTPTEIRITSSCPSVQGRKVDADITLEKAPGHETLNVVIPWSNDEFHFTSKQNTLPARGGFTLDGETFEFKPETSFGVLDFGRGMWPKTIIWNWGSFNHRQDGDLIGINIGAKWTDGTGANENGICLNGKLYKISEDVVFSYNKNDFWEPWTIKTSVSNKLDLKLTPTYENAGGTSSGGDSSKVVAANHQMFGHYSGTLRAGDRTIHLKNAYGWAEEHIGNW